MFLFIRMLTGSCVLSDCKKNWYNNGPKSTREELMWTSVTWYLHDIRTVTPQWQNHTSHICCILVLCLSTVVVLGSVGVLCGDLLGASTPVVTDSLHVFNIRHRTKDMKTDVPLPWFWSSSILLVFFHLPFLPYIVLLLSSSFIHLQR